jgi:predicted nuclease of restriction endonuclease-like (RecB) superfamily
MKDENMTLAQEIKEIIDKGVLHAYTTVNAIAALTYWRVGRRIVEEEQNGEARAEYGSRLLHSLSQELIPQYGESYNERNLRSYRQFFSLFPDFEIWYACVPNLSWTHIRQVLPVVNEDARYWYLREASRENWSARTLARNVGSQYYQRLLQSPKKDAVVAEMLEKTSSNPPANAEMVKSPVVAEFLNLGQNTDFTESDLEKSIIGQIGKFIMELGRGFSFVARQQHIIADGHDYFIDLVFYNYVLKCFFLIDLKTSELTHRDVGQMDMYVRMYDDLKRTEGDNPTIGLLLCTETGKDIAKYSVLNGNKQLFAAKYLTYLPSEEELRKEIERQKEIFEAQHRIN